MVRLKDIAEVCGVSVATVSRALNGLTSDSKERTAFIVQTAKDMGYYPNAAARTLKTSRSNNLGIIYEDRMNHEYFSSLFDELRREAERHSYDLTFLGRGNFTDKNYYEHARQRSLDGVIVVQADFESAGIIRLATSSIPTVIVDHAIPRIISQNILPFLTSVIVTLLAAEMPSYISWEVFLSFIGIGLSATVPSLGRMIQEGQVAFRTYPWAFWPPVAIAALLTIILYVLGQNLADATDPRTHM